MMKMTSTPGGSRARLYFIQEKEKNSVLISIWFLSILLIDENWWWGVNI